ncbi:MAG: type II toxin-antitoxin system VapC family toxin [Candidatus Geothermarchaeales archaeon]
MYLLDTNVFLEVLLSRRRKRECKQLLNLLKTGEETGVATDFSIHSIMLVMDGLGKLPELGTFVASLSAYRGLLVYADTLEDKIRAVSTSQEEELDIDDSIQYSVAKELKVRGIVTFDRDFDDLDIPRLEPRDVLVSSRKQSNLG